MYVQLVPVALSAYIFCEIWSVQSLRPLFLSSSKCSLFVTTNLTVRTYENNFPFANAGDALGGDGVHSFIWDASTCVEAASEGRWNYDDTAEELCRDNSWTMTNYGSKCCEDKTSVCYEFSSQLCSDSTSFMPDALADVNCYLSASAASADATFLRASRQWCRRRARAATRRRRRAYRCLRPRARRTRPPDPPPDPRSSLRPCPSRRRHRRPCRSPRRTPPPSRTPSPHQAHTSCRRGSRP